MKRIQSRAVLRQGKRKVMIGLSRAEGKNKLMLFMAAYFTMHMCISCQYNYMSLFFESHGMTDVQIGILMGVGPLAATIGQYTWANVADKASSINKVLLSVMSVAALTLVPYFVLTGFPVYLVTIIVYNFFVSAATPLYDTMCLYYAAEKHYAFGHMRMVGSLGYLLCMISSGILVAYYVGVIFVIQAVAFALFLFFLSRLPKIKMPRLKKAAFNPMVMLRKPSVAAISGVLLVLHFGYGLNTAFFTPYFVTELGAPSYFISIGAVLSIAIEVTYFTFFDRLVQRVPFKVLFAIAASLSAVRWLICGVTQNIYVLMVSFAFEGITSVGPIYLSVYYFKRVAPPEGKTSAQTLVHIITFGIGKCLGSFVGPHLTAALGGNLQTTYAVLCASVATAVVIFTLLPVKFQQQDNSTAGVVIE